MYRPLSVFAAAGDDVNPVLVGCDQAKIADVDNAPSIMQAVSMAAVLFMDILRAIVVRRVVPEMDDRVFRAHVQHGKTGIVQEKVVPIGEW